MGSKDTLTKAYMSNPEHFADAFNYYFFGGKPVIQAESLTEQDPTEISIIFDESSKEVNQKFRDVVKQCVLMENDMASYIILGIENQMDIHYAMPVRNMVYDSLNYGKQVSLIARQHRDQKDVGGDEFLSGFAKEDKLKPVFTLTIYFGNQEWDAPRKLSDMFDMPKGKMRGYINDYSLNLIVPNEIEDFSGFTSELKNVLEFIARSNDKPAMKEIAKDKSYQNLQTDTVQLINECTGANIPIHVGETEVNMCKGMDDWAIEIGVQASIEAWQDADFPMEDILSRLERKYHLTEEAALAYYKQFSLQTV